MSVVVVTRRYDPTADHVILRLTERDVAVARFDLAEFPAELAATGFLTGGGGRWSGKIRTVHRVVELEQVGAVWYRKPTRFTFDAAMTATERAWSEREAKAGFGGLLAALPAKWINHPHRISACDQRPVQLAAAVACGLSVPATIVTNDPDEARAFCADHPGGVIYKSLRGGPRTEGGNVVSLYTTVVTEGDITDDVRHTAHLLQAAVPKAFEIRLTCVGQKLFPLRIEARTPAGWIDWRADHDELDYAVTDIPDHVATGVRAMMRHFGLVYAAIDLIVTPEGDIVFTGDLNSNGQWAWDHPLRESIADALADELGEHRACPPLSTAPPACARR